MTSPLLKTRLAQIEESLASEDKALAWRAIQELKRFIRREGEAAVLWDLMGRASCILGHLGESVKAHRRSIRLAPEAADVWFDFGVSLWKLEQATQAIDVMQKAVSLSPEDDVAPLYLAQWYHVLGRSDVALNWVEQSLLRSRGKVHLAWYALILADLGHYEKATEAVRESVAGFVREGAISGNWRPSFNEALKAFYSFATQSIGEVHAQRLLRIASSSITPKRDLAHDPQLERLREVAAANPLTAPEGCIPGDGLGDYSEFLPLFAEPLSESLENPWRSEEG